VGPLLGFVFINTNPIINSIGKRKEDDIIHLTDELCTHQFLYKI